MRVKLSGEVGYSSPGYLEVWGRSFLYAVEVPVSITENTSSAPGEYVDLFIHEVVKETGNEFYGFESRSDRDFFKLLLGVSGIGPKTALAMFNKAGPGAIKNALASKDVKALSSLKGIGPKTAERLVFHLGDVFASDDHGGKTTARNENEEDAVLALTALGLKVKEAKSAVAKVEGRASMDTSCIVREALRTHNKKTT